MLTIIRKRWVMLCLFLMLGVFGYYSWTKLSIEAYPDIADVTSQVVTQVPGLAAEEVEQQITIPLERAINGLPGMHVMRSKSTFGLSMITIVFKDGTEDYWSRQRVQERLNEVELPYGAVPGLDPLTSPIGEVYRYLIESDKHSLRELTDLQNWVVIPRIKEVSGVADVTNFGGITTQFQVEVDPRKLEQYDLSLAQVIEAIENNNANVGGSVLNRGDLGYVVRGIGLIEGLDDLGKIVVSSEGGVPIFLNDLGTLKYGNLERKGVFGYSDRTRQYSESLEGIVLLLKHENPSEVLDGIHAAVDELNNSILPEGARIHVFLDRTSLVNTTLSTVSHTLMMGMALVILVLILFLGNWRGALLVSVTIPIALLIAFILMRLTDIPANLLSLGAIDFGIIVDGAIVMMETILKKREDHQGEYIEEKSIAQRAREVGKPILFSTVIIITAYLPLFAFERVERKLFTPMAFTMSYAMIGALMVALLLIPGIAYAIYRKPRKIYKNRWLERLRDGYAAIVEKILNTPRCIMAPVAVILIAGIVLSITVGKDFLPTLDEGSIWLQVNLPPGLSVEKSREMSDTLRARTMKYPEVTYIAVQAGRNDDGTDPFTPSHFEVSVGIKPYDQWPKGKTKEDLIEELAAEYETLPGFRVGFSQPMIDGVMDKIAGAHSELVVKVYGNEPRETRRIAEEVLAVLAEVPGAVDLDIDQEPPLPQLQILMDRDAIARYGLNVSDVSDLIEVAIGGKAVAQLYQGDRQYDITCKYKEEARDTPEKIAELMLTSATGAKIPLSQVAEVKLSTGESTITREMNRRHLTVKLNLRDRDLASFLKEAQSTIDRQVKYDKDKYTIKWGGQFENQHRAYSRLAVIIPLTLMLMFILLYSTFGKFRQAALVLCIVPLALFGGMLALNVRGMTLNVSSAVGFIAMFGLSIQNGIIMVSHINGLRSEGMSLRRAVAEGARHRFRPILMTSTTTIIGLLPASLATGIGSDVQRPLATVIVYGLMFSTLISMFVLPTFYYLVELRHRGTQPSPVPKESFPGAGHSERRRAVQGPLAMLLLLFVVCSEAPAQNTGSAPAQELTFQEYLARVGRSNLSYLAERMNIDIAEAEVVAQKVLPDPELEFEAANETFTLGLGYSLELGNKRGARVKLARSMAEYEKLSLEAYFQELRAESADLFLEAILQRELLGVKRDSYEYMRQLSLSDSLRYRSGEITENDLRQSRLEASALLNDVYEQEAAYKSALVVLNQYMGLTTDTLHTPVGSWDSLDRDFVLADLLKAGFENRIDLRASEKGIEVSTNEYQLTRAERRPDIGLSLSYERNWNGFLPPSRSVTGGVSIPLSFSNTNKGAIRAAKLRIRQSDIRKKDMALQVQTEISQAWYNFEAEKKKVNQYKTGMLEESQKVLDGMVYRYRRGESSIVDVLIAQRTHNDVRQQYLETMKGYAAALVELEKACGTWDVEF